MIEALETDHGEVLVSPSIRRAHERTLQAAARGSRVLLIGPSGSGKELLARKYHKGSGRSGRLVARNCALFSKELLRCELFGAEEGAYTGATRRITGAVEQAHGGTLFLDEIAELPRDLQAMLLRFLDYGEYERIGSDRDRLADVRVVCATNRDLRDASLKGDFRRDLWYRLAIEVIEVPPLRDRPEDLIGYLKKRPMDSVISAYDLLTAGALEHLLAHPWDGNFRELGNFVARLPALAKRSSVDSATCLRLLQQGALAPEPVPAQEPRPQVPDSGPWAVLTLAATQAFLEDKKRNPHNWNEVLEYVERYLKPLIFAHLSGVQKPLTAPREFLAVASRLDANRGTAQKQLQRYFERFMGRTGER